jgi:hypothetical protein
MLDERERSAADVGDRVERALDPAYWEALLPDEPISGAEPQGTTLLADRDEQEIDAHLSREGWASIPDCADAQLVSRTRRVAERVREAGWPPNFAFVYEVTWQLSRVPALDRLLSLRLGGDYRQLPYSWVFRVAATPGAAGWEPHTDGVRGRDVVTVWIALTDSTLDNGCVYVLPRSRVPAELRSGLRGVAQVSRAHMVALLHAARALPVSVASALLWDSDTIHWGSYAEGGPGPRFSVATLYVRAAVADESVLFDPRGPGPAWLPRVGGCAQSILRYGRDEPSMRAHLPFAQALVERVRSLDPSAVMPRP